MHEAEQPDLDAFREEVRTFVAARHPGPKPHYGTRSPVSSTMPAMRRWVADLYRAGYIGADWPVECGGSGVHDPARASIVAEEIARAGTWPPFGGSQLAAGAIINFGTADQRTYYLPRIRSGEDVWCQLFSEPEAGSDLANLRTRARVDGGDFVINGQKVWTTNGHLADKGYLLARTGTPDSRHRGITAFVLDMRLPGVTVQPLREITGTADFNEVFFDNVRLPRESIIGKVDGGWTVAMTSLAYERGGIAAMGAALRPMLDRLVTYAKSSVSSFGHPDSAATQAVGRFLALAFVNDAMNVRARAIGADDPEARVDASARKIFFSELNLALSRYAIELQGAGGVVTEGDPAAIDGGWWQDAMLYGRGFTIAGGSNDVMRNVIAERGLGLPRETNHTHTSGRGSDNG